MKGEVANTANSKVSESCDIAEETRDGNILAISIITQSIPRSGRAKAGRIPSRSTPREQFRGGFSRTKAHNGTLPFPASIFEVVA